MAAPGAQDVHHPDATILAAEKEMSRLLRAFNRHPPSCDRKAAAAGRAWNRYIVAVLRARPRTAAGAAAMLRTVMRPDIGLPIGVRNDGADFRALRSVLRFIDQRPDSRPGRS